MTDENRVLVSRETFGTYSPEGQMLTLYDAILCVNDKVESMRGPRRSPWVAIGTLVGTAMAAAWCWIKAKGA
jgi:hypothetical protein